MRDPTIGKIKKHIRPASSRSAGWLSCLSHIHSEFGRLGLSSSDLNHYQSHALFALEDGLNENVIEDMYRWWDYDLEALKKRGTSDRPAKPRVELWMHFNQRGNFSLLWEPQNLKCCSTDASIAECRAVQEEPTKLDGLGSPDQILCWLTSDKGA